MAAKTITEAKRLAKSFGNSLSHISRCSNGILVGGLNSNANAVLLTIQEEELITTCMETSPPGYAIVRVEKIVFKFRSLFKPLEGIDGVLYRVDEDIIFTTSRNVEEVARVKAFLSVLVNGSYCTLAKIDLYQKLADEDMLGEELRTDYFDVVELSNEFVVITVSSISRKVMLYPHPVSSMETFAVVDFERPFMPISCVDTVIPFYPMVNDIVVIRGENDEIWVARILRINTEERTVKVWYYREEGHELFVPEVSLREALDIVNWDSIVHLAPEEWIAVRS